MELWMIIIGASMAFADIPQILKLIKRKSSKDISLLFWFIILHGQLWWLGYGIYIKSISLAVSNFICVMFAIYIIVLVFKYRKVLK